MIWSPTLGCPASIAARSSRAKCDLSPRAQARRLLDEPQVETPAHSKATAALASNVASISGCLRYIGMAARQEYQGRPVYFRLRASCCKSWYEQKQLCWSNRDDDRPAPLRDQPTCEANSLANMTTTLLLSISSGNRAAGVR